MKFAIIAAGEGSRLSQEGVAQPKPLVPLHGEAMIERLLRIFVDCGATEIVVIVNEWSVAVRERLEKFQLDVPLRLVVKTTPSSMHSLHALSPYLRGERFCLTTVDTIFREEEFKAYIRHFQQAREIDGCMAVTPFVDDEKPLWVGTDEQLNITGFHDVQEEGDRFISGGIYCLGDKALDVLDHCMEQGMSRMRNFQRQLVAEGLQLEAYSIPKILDVDHKDDIAKAEQFLHPLEDRHLLGICRGSVYSPNCVDNDAAIMTAVTAHLQSLGASVDLLGEEELCKREEELEAAGKQARQAAMADIDGVFSMARSRKALDVLERMEQMGMAVLNPSRGIDRCIRRSMTRILQEGNVSHPQSWYVEQGESAPQDLIYPCWLKRGDGCAQQKEDTCYIKSHQEAEQCLQNFWQRGVKSVVINEHLEGDLIKFYGVMDTNFFHWLYPYGSHRSKFGLEEINGAPKGFRFDENELKQEADEAARLLGVPVYGGDCIVDADGKYKIIDFNDWPSFAPCREDAAYYIAMYFTQRMLQL